MKSVNFHIGSAKFRIMSMVLFLIFLLITGTVTYFVLKYNRYNLLQGVGNSLETVRKTTTEGLKIWVSNEQAYMKHLGHHSKLNLAVKKLLKLPTKPDILIASPELEKVRILIRQEKERFGELGFFIINSDFISIGSMRDTNIGTKNIIAKEHQHLLERVFNGETLFIPPMISDVILDKQSLTKELPSTIFMATPLYDENQHVVAVLTNRLALDKVFIRMIQLGRIGKTGESYAFNNAGVLLSESRFHDQLVQMGLLTKNQSSILHIESRDPSVNIMGRTASQVSNNYQHPLTLMTKSAIQGNSGTNVEGYNNYRGIPVLGSWGWDETLGIGIVTEIDVSEALAGYRVFRISVLVVLLVVTLLFMLTLIFVVIFGEQTTKRLLRSRDNLEKMARSAVYMLGEAGHHNDNDTGAHIWRMAAYSEAIARNFGWPKAKQIQLRFSAPMHDTGKIGISDKILKAARKLTAQEWEIMKTHTTLGHTILSRSDSNLFQSAASIALNHHENWDGTGYPSGISGEDIPEEARIVAIADVFDALTMMRPYKEAWSFDKAMAEIKRCSGTQFDPKLVECFCNIQTEIKHIHNNWSEWAENGAGKQFEAIALNEDEHPFWANENS